MYRIDVLSRFRFSPFITLLSLSLAAVMLWASHWQWTRYKDKIVLLQTYASNQSSPPLSLPALPATPEQFDPVLNHRVRLKGAFDYSRQFVVTNRQGPTGAGHHLFTPLKLAGSDWHLLVSRGFIPFEQRTPADWSQYDFAPREVELDAVVKRSIPKGLFAPPPASQDASGFPRIWLYPDIEQIAKRFPYPVVPNVFLQRLGPPPRGQFPAEAVSVEIPPQVHFGYTIEWIVLAFLTLGVGFAVQAFPRRG